MIQQDMFEKALHPMQRAQVDRITEALANMGCTYSIALPDGELLTNAPAKPEKPQRTRARSIHSFGEVRAYIRPFVDNLPNGKIAIIPAGKYRLESIQSGAASYLSHAWGAKTYQTTIDRGENAVIVCRKVA
jgi:hypothetical protein